MLWFDYGDRPEVFERLRDNLKMIPSEVWLEVVPQLIARLVGFFRIFSIKDFLFRIPKITLEF